MSSLTTIPFTGSFECGARSPGLHVSKNKLELSGKEPGTSATIPLEVPNGASVRQIEDLIVAKIEPLLRSDLDAPEGALVQCSSKVVLDPAWVAQYQRRR